MHKNELFSSSFKKKKRTDILYWNKPKPETNFINKSHTTFNGNDDKAVEEECHRMKNTTSDTLKNLCIKTKAWNFKKNILQGDMKIKSKIETSKR